MSFLESDPNYRDPDDELRALLERHHLILEMEATPGWALWRDFLAAEASAYQNRLLLGKHQDMLEYRHDAGVLHGIRLALGVDEKLNQRVSGLRRILDESRLPDDEAPLADMEDDFA